MIKGRSQEVAMNRTRSFLVAAAAVTLVVGGALLHGQAADIKPVTIGQPMPAFSLPTFQGGTFDLAGLKGKNVMLIFPRGFAAEGRWCTIDNYKYAEIVDLDKTADIRKKYNVEVVYVFPYARDLVAQWVDANPDQLVKIKDWKNPADPAKLDDASKARMERWRTSYPKNFGMEKGKVPLPFPILIDADRKLSKGLGLFATDWGGSKVDQNMTSVFIVDKKGILQFKYIGQSTVDRPEYNALFKTLDQLNK
jgi:peroxiredoxin